LADVASLLHAARLLEVLPFLPPGRGALILILGGLIVLPFSLLMSRVGAGRAASHAPRVPQPILAPYYQEGSSMRALAVPKPNGSREAANPVAFAEVPHMQTQARPWQGTAMERALRIAVGATHLLAASPGHYVVSLGRCESCARRLSGCGLERGAIERAMEPYLRRVQVTERACGQRSRRTACTFDIRGA
jgi:hypothetical protein